MPSPSIGHVERIAVFGGQGQRARVDLLVLPSPPINSSFTSTMPTRKQNAGTLDAETYKRMIASNAEAISRFGGRLAVLYKFTTAVMSQLDPVQRIEIAKRLRAGVDDVLSLTDDIAVPNEYHDALLEQTNILLNALEAQRTEPQ